MNALLIVSMRGDGRYSLNSLYPSREAFTESISDLYNDGLRCIPVRIFHLYSFVYVCLRSLNNSCDAKRAQRSEGKLQQLYSAS